MANRRPYVVGGRQIDGSITVDGTTYLVELKFTREQSEATDIDSLLAKVSGKETSIDTTLGNIELLLEKLPSEKDLLDKKELFRKALAGAQLEGMDIYLRAPGVTLPGKGKISPQPAHNKWNYTSSSSRLNVSYSRDEGTLSPTAMRYEELRDSVNAMQGDVSEFNDSVLTRAQAVKRHNEHLADITLWISGAFVLLGFAVGVLAKMYGEEEVKLE